MGAANVIPGVSGGTIAFVTGIYEPLIEGIKRVDAHAMRCILQLKFRSFAEYVNAPFLFWVFLGVGVSILSLARIMDWAFTEHEVLTLAFFFGLIVASIIGVGRQVSALNGPVLVSFVIGLSIAVGISFLPPASPDGSLWYVFLCGIVAVCSMILPGLSGSYILLLMGNYALVLAAISSFDLGILAPLVVGVVVGLALFSRLLSWLFSHYKDLTISSLTGFVAGSLLIIWPWKDTQYESINGEPKAVGYDWFFPAIDGLFFLAIGLMIAGFLAVWILDRKS